MKTTASTIVRFDFVEFGLQTCHLTCRAGVGVGSKRHDDITIDVDTQYVVDKSASGHTGNLICQGTGLDKNVIDTTKDLMQQGIRRYLRGPGRCILYNDLRPGLDIVQPPPQVIEK